MIIWIVGTPVLAYLIGVPFAGMWAEDSGIDDAARPAYTAFWPFFAARGLVRSLIHAVKHT